MTPLDRELVRAWLAAAGDPTVSALLESIYSDLDSEIKNRGPACWASGRCCNFEAAGHRLYVTGLESAYTVARLTTANGTLSQASLAEAIDRGGCPFQAKNLCGVHKIKPLACRAYFCDRTAEAWQNDVTERMHARVRSLHELHAIPYRYAEWRTLLHMFVASSGEA